MNEASLRSSLPPEAQPVQFQYYLDAYWYCVKNKLDHHTKIKKIGNQYYQVEVS